MFPAGFDADGLLYANTRFGDFPHYLPTHKWQDRNELFAEWMLLSYRKPCHCSSALTAYPAINVTDENPRTLWVAASNHAGQWVSVDLGSPHEVKAVQVNYTDYQSGIFASDTNVYTQFRLVHSPDGATWSKICDLSAARRDRPNAYIEFKTPVQTRFIKYEHTYAASPNLAISDLRVFGRGTGQIPETPQHFVARRDSDPRNAFLAWEKVPDVVGYNVLWGVQPEKLYQTYQVFADEPSMLEIRALTVGQRYSFAIEAFNENGVSKASLPVDLE